MSDTIGQTIQPTPLGGVQKRYWESGEKGCLRRANPVIYKTPFSLRQSAFTVAGRNFIWQQGLGAATTSSPALDLLDTWKCVASVEEPPGYSPTDADISPEPVASPSAQESPSTLHRGVSRISGMFRKDPTPAKEVLIRFMPPQPAVVQGELAIDPSVAKDIVSFLISAILLTTRVDDWRHFQSSLPPREVEATLVADRSGTLPPYSADASRQTERTTEDLHPTLSNSTRWRWNGDSPESRRGSTP